MHWINKAAVSNKKGVENKVTGTHELNTQKDLIQDTQKTTGKKDKKNNGWVEKSNEKFDEQRLKDIADKAKKIETQDS